VNQTISWGGLNQGTESETSYLWPRKGGGGRGEQVREPAEEGESSSNRFYKVRGLWLFCSRGPKVEKGMTGNTGQRGDLLWCKLF